MSIQQQHTRTQFSANRHKKKRVIVNKYPSVLTVAGQVQLVGIADLGCAVGGIVVERRSTARQQRLSFGISHGRWDARRGAVRV